MRQRALRQPIRKIYSKPDRVYRQQTVGQEMLLADGNYLSPYLVMLLLAVIVGAANCFIGRRFVGKRIIVWVYEALLLVIHILTEKVLNKIVKK